MTKLAATLALCCLALLAASAAGAPNRRLLIPGGNWVEEDGTRFYSNPAQKPASEECTDVAPDDRYTCEQQKSFGACERSFMRNNNFCLSTCGRCEGQAEERGESRSVRRNPSQRNITSCTDVPPDNEYNCTQQFSFGKCIAPYMIAGNYCARSCGRPPCPPVARVPVAPKYATNATTTGPVVVAPGSNVTLPAPTVVAPGVIVTPQVTPANATEEVTPVVPAESPAANATEEVPPVVPVESPAAADNVTVVETPSLAPATTVTTPPLPTPKEPPAINVTEPAVNVTEPAVAVAPPEVNATEPAVAVTPPEVNATEPAVAVTPPDVNATEPAVAVIPPEANVTEPAVSPVAPAPVAETEPAPPAEPAANVTEPAAPAPVEEPLPAVATAPAAPNLPTNVTVLGGNVTILNTTAPATTP